MSRRVEDESYSPNYNNSLIFWFGPKGTDINIITEKYILLRTSSIISSNTSQPLSTVHL